MEKVRGEWSNYNVDKEEANEKEREIERERVRYIFFLR